MTAGIRYRAMNLTTANVATTSIVQSVQLIARNAIRPYAWDVLLNVPPVKNLSVSVVLLNVKNVRKYIVRIV